MWENPTIADLSHTTLPLMSLSSPSLNCHRCHLGQFCQNGHDLHHDDGGHDGDHGETVQAVFGFRAGSFHTAPSSVPPTNIINFLIIFIIIIIIALVFHIQYFIFNNQYSIVLIFPSEGKGAQKREDKYTYMVCLNQRLRSLLSLSTSTSNLLINWSWLALYPSIAFYQSRDISQLSFHALSSKNSRDRTTPSEKHILAQSQSFEFHPYT